jgi:PAS domain S-box-containing protein
VSNISDQEDAGRHRDAARFRSLLETTSDWIWEVDENFRYTYSSPGVRDLLGYEPAEVIGRTPFDLMPPDEAQRVRAALEAMGPRPLRALENVNCHKVGHRVVLETSGEPILDADGAFRGYRGIDRDITQRKQAEDYRNRLVSVLEATSDFVSMADTSGRVVYVNRAARFGLGVADEESVASGKLYEYHPAWASTIISDEGIPTAIEHGVWEGETALLHRDGREIPISQVIIAHRASDGTVEYLSTICRDISLRKRIEDLREAYLQAVSHDVRSPLSAAAMLTDLVEVGIDQGRPAAAIKPHLDTIRRSIGRVSDMINGLVESARLEGAILHLELHPIALRPFVIGLLEGSRLLSDSERIDVEVPVDLPPVRSEPDKLERILLNLVGNALKYSPRGTRVAIRGHVEGDVVTVAIADEGPGIDAVDLPHIFERFYRSRNAKDTDGLGLGLYITRMMVQAHGGRIWVESAPGHGATFYFSMPAA